MERIYIKKSDLIEKPLWFHTQNLMQTSTGYGNKLVTEHLVKYKGRKRRIYVSQHSNVGTAYINVKGKEVIVEIDYDS